MDPALYAIREGRAFLDRNIENRRRDDLTPVAPARIAALRLDDIRVHPVVAKLVRDEPAVVNRFLTLRLSPLPTGRTRPRRSPCCPS